MLRLNPGWAFARDAPDAGREHLGRFAVDWSVESNRARESFRNTGSNLGDQALNEAICSDHFLDAPELHTKLR